MSITFSWDESSIESSSDEGIPASSDSNNDVSDIESNDSYNSDHENSTEHQSPQEFTPQIVVETFVLADLHVGVTGLEATQPHEAEEPEVLVVTSVL